MIHEIRSHCNTLVNKNCREMGLYLVRFNGKQGIVRCKHLEKDNTIQLLQSIQTVSKKNVKIETLGTSGTIKSLIKKHIN